MLARLMLAFILLLHPVRGVLAASLDAPQAGEVCGSMCCPLCAEFDVCPCNVGPDDPTPIPEPAAPIQGSENLRLLASDVPFIAPVRSVRVASPRAPPAISLRGLDATVGLFLSRVCLWTT
ncbi:MAG: hypothetical protein AB8F26_04985 [Phycisphaerales bacterium]